MDIFMINVALFVQFCFLIGFLYKKYEHYIHNHRKQIGILFLLSYVVIGFVFFPESRMDVHWAWLINPPICILMSVVGLIGLFALSSVVSKYPKWLLVVGKNSLVIYMMDKYVGIPISLFYHFDDQLYIITFAATLLYLVYSSTASILIARVLNRYVPWVTGHRG